MGNMRQRRRRRIAAFKQCKKEKAKAKGNSEMDNLDNLENLAQIKSEWIKGIILSKLLYGKAYSIKKLFHDLNWNAELKEEAEAAISEMKEEGKIKSLSWDPNWISLNVAGRYSLILLRWIHDYMGKLIKKPKVDLLAMLKEISEEEFSAFCWQDDSWEIAHAICQKLFGLRAIREYYSCRQSDLAGFALAELSESGTYISAAEKSDPVNKCISKIINENKKSIFDYFPNPEADSNFEF